MATLQAVFKAYDVRGIVPDELDARSCRAIGWSFARFTGAGQLLVARDMRPSGEELASAFTAGARAAGAHVIDLGLASTDTLYFASGRLDSPGAVFTASHNPAAYNGIKFCLAGARPVGEETGLVDVRVGAEQALVTDADSGEPEGGYEKRDMLEEYAQHVRSFVDVHKLRPLKVIADVANGMGGLVVPAVMAGLPFHVEILFPELDGTFPNHPADPIQPANLVDLKAAVLSGGADVGLAFDGDADRVFLVDEKAEAVSGSLTTALVAKAMLAKNPGSTILHNLICSKVVPETIREHGGVPLRTRVGHSFIKQVMAETGAVFGGEHSGHYYFRDNYRADSGIIAAMVVLEVMCEAGAPLSRLLEPYRRYAASGEINTQVADPAGTVEALAERLLAEGVNVDRTDGLTVDHGDWWYNLRPSNTEPLLRLNVEAPDARECDARVVEVLDLVTSAQGASDATSAQVTKGRN
ncbi:MAG: phosphohexomutase domain-containing protein [Acidimicrobiales bacterium]